MSENFEAATAEFARLDTPFGYFNIGNAYAHSKNYEEAVESYDSALELKPDYREARENRELVLSLIPEEEDEEEAPPGDPSLGADEIQFDEKGEKGKEGEVDQQQLTEEQIAEMWMRQVQTTPADFLRLKFLIQSEESEEQSTQNPEDAE
jgi:Ca-activated chloride channel family protein